MKRYLLLLIFCIPTLAQESEWTALPQDNLVYLQLEQGAVVIELAPFMAPEHVKQFKALVTEGFYNGLDFYRVIEGFVAQGGDISEQKASKHKSALQAEVSRKTPAESDFMLLQSPAFIAPETGYIHNFAAGRDPATQQEWLLHCPGIVAMARSTELHSGSTDFYIVIGQAPRHLDRNMSTFGRVVYGMEHVQALPRGPIENSGVIDDADKRGKIISASVGSDLPEQQQLSLEVQRQDSESFRKKLNDARTMSNAFFHYKGTGKLDACYHQTRSRLVCVVLK